MAPLISVCVPAYNRPRELGELLATAVAQEFDDYEIVVCEDRSPRGDQIAEIVEKCARENPHRRVRLVRNPTNLGYDGNLRRLIELADGDYCFFMGDDDLMYPHALAKVAAAVTKHPDVGVVIRGYDMEDADHPDGTREVFRYFGEDRIFEPGADSVVTFFRRSTTIAGYVVRREDALRWATDRFDGTLLYQLYLSGAILTYRRGYHIADVLVTARVSHHFYFGSSQAEKGRFEPNKILPATSLNFMRGAFAIARYLDERFGQRVADRIITDYAHYSYSVLALHAANRAILVRYAADLAVLGMWRSWRFFAYVLSLLVLGPGGSIAIIRMIKRRLGRTPQFGKLHAGAPVRS